MAGSKSDYLSGALLNHVLGGSSYTRPPVVYVALLRDTNTDNQRDAGDVTEVTFAGGYARVPVMNNPANWPAASDGAKTNATAIVFATASATWGTIQAFGIYDAATGGNLLYWGDLDTPQAIASGDTATLAIGAVEISES